MPSDLVSGPSWQSRRFGRQTGVFAVEFDATPGAANIDGVTGLSLGPADAYQDLAAIVRFNTAGRIDARDDDRYEALLPLIYKAGTTYRIRMVVNVPARRYSVWVDGQRLAVEHAFRTEQAGATALDTVAVVASIGSHRVGAFTGAPQPIVLEA